MKSKKFAPSAIAGAMVLSLVSFSYTTSSPASAHQNECLEPFHDLVAAVCLSSPEPILGLFGTWKNVPIEFDDDALDRSRVAHTIGFSVPETVGHAKIGLEADPMPYGGYSSAYSPFWEEIWMEGLTYQAITPTRGDTPEPDEVNNTYIMMRDDSESQWDLIYNFNHVGSTEQMPEVQTRQAESLFHIGNPSLTTVGPIENRIQYMGGNMYWMRFASSSANLIMSNPACGDAGADPNFCMDSELVTSSGSPEQLVSWNVGRSSETMAEFSAGPDDIIGDYPKFVNGVNQEILADCLANSPDLCMNIVPGLSECVSSHEVCNALPGYDHRESKSLTMEEEQIGESEASEKLRTRFEFNEKTMSYSLMGVSDYEEAYSVILPDAWGPNDVLWVASTQESVITEDGRTYDGLTAVLDAFTGQLVRACAGDMC